MMKGHARFYQLKSSEGRVFAVDEAVALQSRLVSCLAVDLTEAVGVISPPMVDTETLEKVLEWCKKHMPAYKDAVCPDVLRKWEDEYVVEVISTGSVYRLLTATNYLNIPELLDRLASSMMTQQPARVYWLKSFEGQVFEVHEDVALQSPLVSKQAKEAGGVIQLEGADTRSLRKVIVRCKGRTPAYKSAILLELLRECGKTSLPTLAASPTDSACYMEIKELESCVCNRIAAAALAIAEKDPVEMRRPVLAGIRGGRSL